MAHMMRQRSASLPYAALRPIFGWDISGLVPTASERGCDLGWPRDRKTIAAH
ncbi:hypothetical protein FHW92_003400 [Novosphingobium sp. SG707]|nr:hypothetical protein [Novosphingobium sp. SG707]